MMESEDRNERKPKGISPEPHPIDPADILLVQMAFDRMVDDLRTMFTLYATGVEKAFEQLAGRIKTLVDEVNAHIQEHNDLEPSDEVLDAVASNIDVPELSDSALDALRRDIQNG